MSFIDLFIFKGCKTLVESLELTPGSRDECVDLLKKNNSVLIEPGGVREAFFSFNYDILWAGKTGFARVATDAKVVSIY